MGRVAFIILAIICLVPFAIMAYRLIRDPKWRKSGPDLGGNHNMTVPSDFHG